MNDEVMDIHTLDMWNPKMYNEMIMWNPEMYDMLWNIGILWTILNIIFLASFLLKAWWLYNINTKLGEPYPWLAWVPVIQVYSFVKAAWKPPIWILWLILGFIVFIIPGIIITIILCHEISKRTWRWGWSTLWIFFVPAIMFPVIGYKLKMSKKDIVKSKEEKSPSIQTEKTENKIEL